MFSDVFLRRVVYAGVFEEGGREGDLSFFFYFKHSWEGHIFTPPPNLYQKHTLFEREF